ncbi:hypothetical protein ACFWIQ_09555 [Kitasatospora sp. NPDC127059]|uniref:hypothetical protein n=1 Tax=unclassified Kitasatospora TaxID=2633591 RepID=UPI00366022F0
MGLLTRTFTPELVHKAVEEAGAWEERTKALPSVRAIWARPRPAKTRRWTRRSCSTVHRSAGATPTDFARRGSTSGLGTRVPAR